MNAHRETLRNAVVCVLWMSLFCMTEVAGDGVVKIKFLRYNNPDGKGSNGHCCDGKWTLCSGGCDHKFTVCLDIHNGSPDIHSCYYGQKTSDKIKNQNVNVFNDRFAGLSNPLVFHIKGSISIMASLKVRVIDVDSSWGGGNDHVDDLSAELFIHRGPFASVKLPFTMHSRTTMEAELTVNCAEDWYAEDCSVYCRPSKDDNYFCDSWAGEKICHPGWMGENCDEQEVN